MKANMFAVSIFLLLLVILLIVNAGCESAKNKHVTPEHTVAQETPSQLNSESKQENTLDKIITQIWEERKQKKHKEVIAKVDLLLSNEDCDEDTTATMLFLKADSFRQLGRFDEAIEIFELVAQKYSYAQWIDPEYDEIKVKELCEVGVRLVSERDRSPFPERSEAYTGLAWNYLNIRRFETSLFFADICIKRFEAEAIKQQAEYSSRQTPPIYEPDPSKNKELNEDFWALNDVGTCWLICGQSYEKMADKLIGEPGNSVSEKCIKFCAAIECFNQVIDKYPGAWCFDSRGPWYWRVKDGAKRRNDIIQSQKLSKLNCDQVACKKILLGKEKIFQDGENRMERDVR